MKEEKREFWPGFITGMPDFWLNALERIKQIQPVDWENLKGEPLRTIYYGDTDRKFKKEGTNMYEKELLKLKKSELIERVKEKDNALESARDELFKTRNNYQTKLSKQCEEYERLLKQKDETINSLHLAIQEFTGNYRVVEPKCKLDLQSPLLSDYEDYD